MKYLPIFTQVRGNSVLVIGGGEIALRKARLLADAGARLTIISPEFEPQLEELATEHSMQLIQQQFTPDHIRHANDKPVLVIAATDDRAVNSHVAQVADEQNILINAVDAPDISSFIFPAIIDRSPIVVAVSSGGDAPVLVRRLREKLETLIPQHIGPLGALMGRFRTRVKNKLTTLNQRRAFWENALSSKVVSLLSQNQPQAAEAELSAQLAQTDNQPNQGEVYIVGGGPGDPDLLTIKALQLMQQADVVVYDGLVSPEVLNLVRRDAERISVAKSAGFHSVPQDQINQILVDHAKKGHKVCRLKGGDPFIFGRGGEEVEDLVAAGIKYQIVPGITAAAGCTAYAGIPLTHRDYAQGVQFVTGHCRKDGGGPDWASLAKPNQTLVIYMGLINSSDIVAKLIEHGRTPDLPVAIIERGTTAQQRVVTGQLGQLVDLIQTNQIKSPALIVVGEVVALQQKLHWFGDTSTTSYEQPLVDVTSTVNQVKTRTAA